MMKKRLLESKWLVPALTITVIVVAIWGVLKLTEKVGENLAPIKPRVLIFGASWCPHCPSEAAVVKLISDFPGIVLDYVDVDKYPSVARKYHVKKLPTFIVCSGDKGCKIFHSMTALRAWLSNGEL